MLRKRGGYQHYVGRGHRRLSQQILGVRLPVKIEAAQDWPIGLIRLGDNELLEFLPVFYIRSRNASFHRAPFSKAWYMSLIQETSYSILSWVGADEINMRGRGSGLEMSLSFRQAYLPKAHHQSF